MHERRLTDRETVTETRETVTETRETVMTEPVMTEPVMTGTRSRDQ